MSRSAPPAPFLAPCKDGVYDAFAAKLAAKVSEMRQGPGDQPGATVGPLLEAG